MRPIATPLSDWVSSIFRWQYLCYNIGTAACTVPSKDCTWFRSIKEKRDTAFYNTANRVIEMWLGSRYVRQVLPPMNIVASMLVTLTPSFEVSDWRVLGINICNDANYSNAALNISRQRGARLLCYPLNNMLSPATANRWRHRSVANLQQRAIETGCWVVSSDVVGTHRDKMSYGCTCIVRPDGVVVQRAIEGVDSRRTDLH